jgi:hypothetical protein
MSASFVHAPTHHTTGTGVDEWLKLSWDISTFHGDTVFSTVDGDIPAREAAVVFRNFRPVTGTPGAYFADPVALVAYRPAMRAAMGATRHTEVCVNDVVVPLGTPADWITEASNVVFMQTARQWVSGGRNTANMSMEHVITLYYGALQSLTFLVGTAHTVEEQCKWFPALTLLARAFDSFCRADVRALHVSLALVYTHGVNDMLQKALAHVFAALPLDKVTRYEMLATMVRRNLRHGQMFTGLAPGPFVVFLLVPLLSELIAGMTIKEAQRLFNDRTSALVDELAAIRSAHRGDATVDRWTTVHRDRAAKAAEAAKEQQAACLAALATFAEAPLTVEQARCLLHHCSSTDASVPTPWATWGVLPAPPALNCRVTTQRYSVTPSSSSGHRGAPRFGRGTSDSGLTYHSRIVSHTPTTFEVFGYKGVEWSGVQFHTPGTYTIRAHDIGLAKTAVGDSRGEELCANWRLTVGNTLFPNDEAGYSLAGVRYVPRSGYVTETPLALDAPFDVVVKVDRIELHQSGRTVCTIPRRRADADALLAFKNVWLRVEYTAPPPLPVTTAAAVATAARAVPATYGGGSAAAAGTWAAIAAKPAATPTPFARAATLSM